MKRYLHRISISLMTLGLIGLHTLTALATLVVPELADWCTVHIVQNDGSIEQLAVAHANPDKMRRSYFRKHSFNSRL